MNPSIPLGRLFGFRIGMNWGVLVVFAVIAWGLGAEILPGQYPGLPAAAYAIAAIFTATLFWLSLLAHETAHALVARRNGLAVESITLWLFGGVSKLQGIPKTAGADFRIAGSGPLSSLCLGGGFIGVTAAIVNFSGDRIAAGVFAWLGATNIALALFNSLPGAPLDGGRLLRAFLWRRHGDRIRAAHTATKAGRVLGYIIIALGVLELFYFGALGGLWFGILGWFLISAARSEDRQIAIQERISGKTVGDVMTTVLEMAPAELTVEEFAQTTPHRHEAFPIVDAQGRLAGMVAVKNLRGIPREDWHRTRLRDVACPPEDVATARADESVVDLLPRLTDCTEGRAVVVNDGHLTGIVAPSDITRAAEVQPEPQG